MENKNNTEKSLEIEFLAKNLSIAREACGKTVKECSLLLDIPSCRLKNYEKGKFIPSLPEIEALSFSFRIPITAFFKEGGVKDHLTSPENTQIQRLIKIRQQIIGARIHIAREKIKMSMKQLSRAASIPASRIKRYEEGTTPIALNDLQKIVNALNLDLDDFFDHESPLGNWQDNKTKSTAFEHLPEEIKEFITDSNNLQYLKVAHNLSNISIDTFNKLSDSLTELTSTFQDSKKKFD